MDASMNNPITQSNEAMFPTLGEKQIARLRVRGKIKDVTQGDVLIDPESEIRNFYLVISGRLELNGVRAIDDNQFVYLLPGMFTGELSLVTGRRGFVRISAVE